MYKKTLFGLGLVLLIAASITWYVVQKNDKQTMDATADTKSTSITYVSAETNNTITVAYREDTAELNGLGYRNVAFVSVESASGAKYENSDMNLVLWSKGNEVTLSRGRQTVFVGLDANPDIVRTEVTPVVDETQIVAATTSVASSSVGLGADIIDTGTTTSEAE